MKYQIITSKVSYFKEQLEKQLNQTVVIYKDNYLVSSEGNIYSLNGYNSPHQQKFTQTEKGYQIVSINNRNERVNRVIYKSFNPDIDISDLEIHHINKDRKDNRLINLEAMEIINHRQYHSEYSRREKELEEVFSNVSDTTDSKN